MDIYITLDYELFFGNDSGSVQNSIIRPTEELLKITNKFDIKLVLFVDASYLIALKKELVKHKLPETDYKVIATQLKQLSAEGHDIQLHVHPHWIDSKFDGKKWKINTERYRLHDFNPQEINEIISSNKKALEDISGKEVFAYRAGGWCLQPFNKIKDALASNNIWLDSTVFKGGLNTYNTHYYNFMNVPSGTEWRFNSDPTRVDPNGKFVELPIASTRLSPFFFWKVALLSKLKHKKVSRFGDGSPVAVSKKYHTRLLTQRSFNVASIDGFRASYLQKAFTRSKRKHPKGNFVIIGHPKAFSQFSLQKLEQFIKKVASKNKFCTFAENKNKWQDF